MPKTPHSVTSTTESRKPTSAASRKPPKNRRKPDAEEPHAQRRILNLPLGTDATCASEENVGGRASFLFTSRLPAVAARGRDPLPYLEAQLEDFFEVALFPLKGRDFGIWRGGGF